MGCDAGYRYGESTLVAPLGEDAAACLGEALLRVWRRTDPPLSWASVVTLGWAAGLTALQTADGLSFLEKTRKVESSGNWSDFRLTDTV